MPDASVAHPLLDITAGRRVAIAAVCGFAVGLPTAFFVAWPVAAAVAWDGAAIFFLVVVWLHVGGLTPTQARSHAVREDNGAVGAGLLLIAAALASLVGTAIVLVEASQAEHAEKFFLTVVAVLTVVASWAVVHTVFMLRYAREYYADPVGGIDFNRPEQPPDYRDFAYVAFTVGMTFQVSDTDIEDRTMARTILRHALLAYLFGAVIIAITINVVAQFFS
jgi:uncharacterized membrane protein